MLINSLERYKNSISLFLIVTFCLVNLIWKSNLLSEAANRTTILIDFFSQTFSGIGKGISRFFDSYASYNNLKEERDALKNKVDSNRDLSLKNYQLQEENNRLRQLLAMPPVTEYPVIQAEVISQDPDNWFRTIIINKGSDDGISPYMPVMAIQLKPNQKQNKLGNENLNDSKDLIQGVVGKVIQVNKHSARILSITDKYSRVGILLKRTGHWAMLMGQTAQHELPLIEYLSLSVIPQFGEEVVTSGSNGIFPKNLLIGYIGKKVERLGGFQRAEVIPAIDFQKLDYVYIIKKKWENQDLKFKPLNADSIAEP